jgi:hypothetical protein
MNSNFAALLEKTKAIAQVEDIASMRMQGSLRSSGKYKKGLCPFHNDTNPSFFIDTRKNTYRCYSCGASGDAIEFLKEIDGISFKEAVLQLAGMYGLADTGQKPIYKKTNKPRSKLSDAELERKEIQKAQKLIKRSIPASGTLIETYLKSRAIDPAALPEGILKQLRFLPEYEYWHKWEKARQFEKIAKLPAMIAPMQDSSGYIRGAHVTYLKPDGSGKAEIEDKDSPGKKLPAKKMKGRPWGCAIRLGSPAPVMVFSEGIENGLSSLIVHPDWPVWVAGSLTNLSGAGQSRPGEPHPEKDGRNLPTVYPDYRRPGILPPQPLCKTAYLLAERDSKDQHSVDALIERTLRRWQGIGIQNIYKVDAPDGMDHNDVLRGHMTQKH